MDKQDTNKNKTGQNIPIKLNDLLPTENVKGGKGQTVFGAIKQRPNKNRKGSRLF